MKKWISDHLQSSPLAQCFNRHAGKIAGALFLAGDVALTVNRSLNHGAAVADHMTLAGGVSFVSSAVFLLGDRYPHCLRLGAGLFMASLGLLLYDSQVMDMQDPQRLLYGNAASILNATALIVGVGAEDRAEQSPPSMLRKAFGWASKPGMIATTALAAAASRYWTINYGIDNGEPYFVLGMALWGAANLATAFKDKAVQQFFAPKIS